MVFARWQHDANAQVNELPIVQIGDKVFDVTGEGGNFRAESYRHILTILIWKVDSRSGGWCEVKQGDKVLYHHPDGPY